MSNGTYQSSCIEKDDMSDYEEDYLKYRDELVTNIFSNLAFLKTFIQTLLKGLDHLLL